MRKKCYSTLASNFVKYVQIFKILSPTDLAVKYLRKQ